MHDLVSRMNTGIRPPGAMYRYGFIGDDSQCMFNSALHRLPVALTLPSAKFGAVVLNNKSDSHLLTGCTKNRCLRKKFAWPNRTTVRATRRLPLFAHRGGCDGGALAREDGGCGGAGRAGGAPSRARRSCATPGRDASPPTPSRRRTTRSSNPWTPG